MFSVHRFATALGVVTVLWASSAVAATAEREVVGWTPAGEIVVHLVERGEQMVDGASRDYYFEATEVWSSDTGRVTGIFRHGEAVGTPEAFAQARSAAEGQKYRELAQQAVIGPSNSAKTHRLAWFSKQRIDKPDERSFVCKRRFRVVVLSIAERRAHTLHDAESESAGETVRRPDEAMCQALHVDPYWSADGRRFAAFIRSGDTTTLTAGSVAKLDVYPYAQFSEVPAAHQSNAWRAIYAGLAAEKKATKKADAAYKKSKKTAQDRILRAAAYVAAGQGKKATKWIDSAAEKSASYAELLGFARVFEPVDPNIANQLAVHALSHPSAKDVDTTQGWILLARGLLALGEYSKAEESLAKIDKPTPSSLALLASLHLDRREGRLATRYAEDLLFANPGDCAGYLLQGRLRSFEGDNVDARALFGAAAACDPSLDDAVFYAADFARLAGDVAEAKARFDHYLTVAAPRRSDRIRDQRRAVAQRWATRFAHSGVVLTDVSCRKGGAGYLCTGTIKNTTASDIESVAIEILTTKRKSLGSGSAKVAAGATAPFGVSFATKSLSDVVVTVGRDNKERSLNETPAR